MSFWSDYNCNRYDPDSHENRIVCDSEYVTEKELADAKDLIIETTKEYADEYTVDQAKEHAEALQTAFENEFNKRADTFENGINTRVSAAEGVADTASTNANNAVATANTASTVAAAAKEIADINNARLDTAIAGITVDNEVIDIRVGADGVNYPTAGDAVRGQFNKLNEGINKLNGTLETAYSDTKTLAVLTTMQTYVSNINLKKGTTYKLTASIPLAVDKVIYLYLKDSEGNQITAWNINIGTTSNALNYTPQSDYTGAYVSAKVASVSIAGTELTVSIEEMRDNKLEKLSKEISNVASDVNKFDNITGYSKPNLFKNEISTQTKNGVTFTVNDDKSITITGTATSTTFVSQTVTLDTGTYLFTALDNGAPETYHVLYDYPDGVPKYIYGGNERKITIENSATLTIYFRVMKDTTVNDTFYPMIRNENVYNKTYVPYGEYQIYKPIQRLIDYSVFNWSGKKINVIGDSIVAGSYGNFVNVIRDILQLSVARNYGLGGSCLASSDIDETLPPACIRYTEMDDDADIVIVHAGTNDFSAQIPLGDDNSTDITTFNGALNVLMEGLREKYPTALIIFDNILHRFNDNANEIKVSQYRNCIEQRCLANHIVFYDCYKYSGFDFVKGYYDHILTADGLHPNQKGADILGRKISGFIKWN